MKYYPIFLDINDRDCLVVGGGPVGVRKAVNLEKCGANIKLISDEFSARFDELQKTSICFVKKRYEKEDVKGMFLVFAATNNADLNQQIKDDALEFNILCNVADAPDKSNFLVPSTVDRGKLILAVSTSGSSPALAKKIRQDLERQFGPEYSKMLQLMWKIRKMLLSSVHNSDDNKAIFYTLIEKGLVELIKSEDEKKINAVLHEVLGKGFTYQDLVSLRSDE